MQEKLEKYLYFDNFEPSTKIHHEGHANLVTYYLLVCNKIWKWIYTTQYKCSLSKYRGLRGNSYVENADAYVNKHSIVLDEGTLPCITGQRLLIVLNLGGKIFELGEVVSKHR